jgi:hypothetical protein
MTVLCLSDCDASSAQYFAEVVRKRSDPPLRDPEALKVACEHLVQTIYFKMTVISKLIL